MNSLLKVLYVSPCMGGYGGLEAFTLAVAEGIASEPAIQARVLFKKAGDFSLGDDLRSKIKEAKIPVRFCDKASVSMVQEIRTADIIHLQNPCPDVTLLARLFGKPLITQVINHRTHGNSFHQKLWQKSLALADRRLFISDFVRSTWDPSRKLPHSYVVFPLCKLAEGMRSIQERRGFAFVGRWIVNKGLETLVKAYSVAGLEAQDWPLRLAGQGPLKESVLGLISELGVKGVEVLGFVDEVKKAEVIACSRFMVIPPNTNEDFGLTAIEARNLGIPCIITRDGGLPEAAGTHVISCEPGNVEDLACALRTASEMTPAAYSQMSENTCRSLQLELASPAHYLAHYRAMLSEKTGNARCRLLAASEKS